MKAYSNKSYAKALEQFGKPVYLGNCEGWILERKISGTAYSDGMGIYPLFCCNNWDKINDDLNNLQDKMVSIVFVTDVFGDFKTDELNYHFNDLFVEFKNHAIVDFGQPIEKSVSKHHKYYGLKTSKTLDIFIADNPEDWLDSWVSLYNNLVHRHKIKGIAAFSRDSFSKQFETAGLKVFIAKQKEELAGMQLWFEDNGVGYHHLSAYSDLGYRTRTSYGLMWHVLSYFQDKGLKAVDLGASAGLSDHNDGLSAFKSGWCNLYKPVYLCGKILQPGIYEQLNTRLPADINYFPKYRYKEIA